MNCAPDSQMQQRMARTETLVAEVEALCGTPAGQQVHDLVQLVLDMHRDALQRMIRQIGRTAVGESLLRELVDDELVAGVLLLHNLHPLTMADRVRAAVQKIRPYLQSHDSDVELLNVVDGAATLRIQASCAGCPATANSFRLLVENAIYDAAPDLTNVNIQSAEQPAARE